MVTTAATASPPAAPLAFLRVYLAPYWRKALLLAGLLLGHIGLQLVNPQVLRAFIDATLAGGLLADLISLALLFLGVAVVNQLLAAGATYLSQDVGWSATNLVRADLARHCLELDLAFHNARTPGELIERIDGDVTALSTFFSQLVILIVGSGLLLVGALALIAREDWRVGLALGLFTAVALAILHRLRYLAVPALRDERQAHADLFGFVEERLAGLDDIRANGAGAYAMRGLHGAMRTLFRHARRAWLMRSAIWMTTTGLFILAHLLIFALGAYLFSLGAVTVGTVFLFYQYTEMLRNPLEQITRQMQELQKALASLGRVQELRAVRPTVLDGPGATLPAGPLAVAFDRVSFAYEADDPVLSDLSLALRPGTVLGLLGRTGSGKTTLARLLFRLVDPTAGAIRLGGVDTRAPRLADLRRRVGFVTQSVQLFRASVRDNLTFFDPAVPDAAVLAVIEELGLAPWLATLPDGLDEVLPAGGGGLSAGEAQLLAFARVFLKDPGLVVLDEASSRLDPATEALIERAIDRLLRDRTAIIIAHRLATVQRADEILILEDGHIAEHGARARLAADPASRFARLLRTGLEEALV
jgi:ATP-binding cassette, subfamily B, bacterial